MRKAKKPANAKGLTFDVLVENIRLIDSDIAAQVGRAVNIGLTLRNWLIGHRIAEYELNGADRAKYGAGLLAKLSRKLEGMKVSGCGKRQLYQFIRTSYGGFPIHASFVTHHLRCSCAGIMHAGLSDE